MEVIALTLRETVGQVNKKTGGKKMTLHQEFVEARVIPHLQEAACEGKRATGFTAPGYDYTIVCDLLRNFGFTTEVIKYDGSRYIIVKW